jgi:hypothetical protein
MLLDWASVGITVMTYSRPNHAARLFEALRNLNVERFSVFMDGADDHQIRESQDEIVKMIETIDWADIDFTRRSINMGLRRSIVSAVTEQLTKHDKVILLEDDCVPYRGYFEFMFEALTRFESRRDVRTICGYQFPSVAVPGETVSAVASTRFVPWGWGTWRDRWYDYDTDLLHLLQRVEHEGLFPALPEDIRGFLESWERTRDTDIWSINWVLVHYLTGTCCVYPSRSLLRNIGFDGTGVHCYETDAFTLDSVGLQESQKILIDPDLEINVEIDREIVEYMERNWSSTMSPRAVVHGDDIVTARVGELIREIIEDTGILDPHTHLSPAAGGGVSCSGPDALLTYHYLVVEALDASNLNPRTFFSMSQYDQATFVWDTLFRKQTPLSEACHGVLTVLEYFGVTTGPRNYSAVRNDLMACTYEACDVFSAAGVESVVMTNDPFDADDWRIFSDPEWDRSSFLAAIRLDQLVSSQQARERFIRSDASVDSDAAVDVSVLGPFLDRVTDESQPVYASLSIDGDALNELMNDQLFLEGVLPWLRRHRLPLALMLGVKRRVNPSLRLGGDGVGGYGLDSLESLVRDFPEQHFLVTHLREDAQHSLTVLARKFPNLTLLGFWWFVNQPSLVMRNLEMRFDLLGLNFIPHHSDARVLEQLIYKWTHFKDTLREVLSSRYRLIARQGWPLSREMVEQDIRALLFGNAAKTFSSVRHRFFAKD